MKKFQWGTKIVVNKSGLFSQLTLNLLLDQRVASSVSFISLHFLCCFSLHQAFVVSVGEDYFKVFTRWCVFQIRMYKQQHHRHTESFSWKCNTLLIGKVMIQLLFEIKIKLNDSKFGASVDDIQSS
jgi:hypothetical protein